MYNEKKMIKEEKMKDLRKEIDNGENLYQRLIEKIPGFEGYFEREKRRTADKLLRQYLADRLRKAKDILLSKGNELLKQKDFETLGELNDLIKRFQFVIDKIEYAPHGYSGFFGAIKVNSEVLNELYSIDASLVTLIEDAEKIVSDETKTVKERISIMRDKLKAFEGVINKRNETLSGIN